LSPSLELLSAVVRYRIDAIAIVILTIAACGIVRSHLRRPGAKPEPSGKTCAWVIALPLMSALLLELLVAFLPAPALALETVVLIRGMILGAAAVGAAGWLIAAARIALLRAELRVRADSGRQLQQAKASADEASRAKSDFLAVMSHEIRTPLNAVVGFANLLSETRLDETQRNYLGTIKHEGARLASLINDILDLTKIEKGGLVLEHLPFAPAETAQEVMRSLSGRAAEKKLDLRFEAHLAEPLLVAGDSLRFRQILSNLIDNAIKFTPRGSITLFMAWYPPIATASHGQLAIRVCDTGIGIPAAKLPDIFQMFMQADNTTARRYGGAGLGLALCHRLVTLMGGEIVARSTQGEGSQFSLTLPLPPASPPRDDAVPPAGLEIAFARPPRILVVDDMETNRFLLEVFLRRQGFDPELANGGQEAIRLALTNRYDAILMDLQMPDVDGYTAARRIREAETGGRRTPIIALTASVAQGTREKCLAAGMDEHLTKPIDLPRFKTLLNSLRTRALEAVTAAGS